MSKKSEPMVFAGGTLDRASNQRRDSAWLAERRADERSRYLPFHRLNVLVKTGKNTELGWARAELCESMNADTGALLLGLRDGVAHFAVDVSALEEPETALGLSGVAAFSDVRAVAPRLPPGEASIVAQGRALVDWHARHRFCPVCGSATSVRDAGYMRECNECDAEHFPRTDPVVIMLVASGDRCLLGRQRGWPAGMFSALAGFIEQGETLEEAVRREVLEEAGIPVDEVRYHACQPWPFPSSLMIGCMARATGETLRIDHYELEDARWFGRDKIRSVLDSPGADDGLFVPPPFAIAHHLIRAWADSDHS